MTAPVSQLIEERGWLIGYIGHRQLEVMVKDVPIECAKPVQTIRTRHWSRSLLGDKTSKPLLGSLEVFLMFVVEINHKAKDEGEWGLEWTVVRESCSENDEEVEEETERSETDGDAGDNLVYEEEVVGEGIAEEGESALEHQG